MDKKKRSQLDLELQEKEESLSELLLMLDEFAPIIPDSVTDYYLGKGGLQTDDIRLKRLLAMTTQKFISDIAADAMQHAKVRQQTTQIREKKARPVSFLINKDKRIVLTMEDLSFALADHGVQIKKPEYFA